MDERDAIATQHSPGSTAGPLRPRAQSNPSAQSKAPRAGQKLLPGHGATPSETRFKQNLCADIDGFRIMQVCV